MKNVSRRHAFTVIAAAAAVFVAHTAMAQELSTVTAQVQISALTPAKKGGAPPDLSNVVVWLTPLAGAPLPRPQEIRATTPAITQQNKSFTPHVLVIQTGTSVLFPNRDRFLHNVFSLHEGKQFDLGFYEAGSSKAVRFDRPGVSYLFCNIHPEMTAAVIVVPTPYFALSDSSGRLAIPAVLPGRYLLHVWSEQGMTDELKKLEREVAVNGPVTNLGLISLLPNPTFTTEHKNKYGQDYLPPPSADYTHP